MELVKQTSAQIIFSEYNSGGNSMKITVRSADNQNGLTKLTCAVVQRLSSDVLSNDWMLYDVGIKFIVNMYMSTDDLWNTSESDMKYLTELHDFRVELEDIPEIEIGTADSRIPAGIDPYRMYKDNRSRKFGVNLFSDVQVGLKVE